MESCLRNFVTDLYVWNESICNETEIIIIM